MLLQASHLPDSLLLLKFLAFAHRSIGQLHPSNCILIHHPQYAPQYVERLLLMCNANNHSNSWQIVDVSQSINVSCTPALLRSITDQTLIVTLLPVADVLLFVRRTYKIASYALRQLFVLLEGRHSDLCTFFTRQHINGVIVRLHDDPIGMVVWNGFTDTTVTFSPNCSFVQTEAEFFDVNSFSAAIFANRLLNLNIDYTLSVTVFPMPPAVFLVSDEQRRWSRLAGTDVSLFRFVMQRMRVGLELRVQNIEYKGYPVQPLELGVRTLRRDGAEREFNEFQGS